MLLSSLLAIYWNCYKVMYYELLIIDSKSILFLITEYPIFTNVMFAFLMASKVYFTDPSLVFYCSLFMRLFFLKILDFTLTSFGDSF